MLEFREINIDDRDWINKLLKKSDFMGCEYSFANNMAWRRMNDSTISRLNDFYIVKSEDKNYVYFTFPAGNGDYQDLFDKLLKYSEYKNKKMVITGVTDYGLSIIKNIFNNQIIIKKFDSNSDYIYLAEDLIYLKGKKFHKKRNHLSKINNYNWEFHPMTKMILMIVLRSVQLAITIKTVMMIVQVLLSNLLYTRILLILMKWNSAEE